MKNSQFVYVMCVTVMFATPMAIGAWQERPSPVIKPMPSPNAPKNQNAPRGLDGPELTVDNPRQALDQQNQVEIRMEVQRLFAMATELKDEVDNTNSNTMLNLTVLKRAQEIEKLAKQIRDRAKK